jgi:hypothetical protein
MLHFIYSYAGCFHSECHYAEYMLNVTLLSVVMLNAECRYAECHYVECLGTIQTLYLSAWTRILLHSAKNSLVLDHFVQ